MTTHTPTERALSNIEQTVLNTVRERPNLTTEDYADILGHTTEFYSAIAYLIIGRFVYVDERNGAISAKGL